MSKATPALLLLAAGFLLAAAPALAQDLAVYSLQPESELTVDGTSNTGDWTVNATEIMGVLKMHANASAEAPGIQDVQMTIPTEKIKGRNILMSKNLQQTLKVKQYKEIRYTLKQVVDSAVSDEAPNVFTMSTLGDLTIAGETREIAMTVSGTMLENGQVHLEGSYSFKMSDYNLTDRRFMFGRFVLADEVNINYKVKFAPEVAGSQ